MPLTDTQRIERETDPPVIYLSPRCEVVSGDGRLWCEDPQPCDDSECPYKPVRYIRAEVTPEMVGPAAEQARVDSSLNLDAITRIERILKAALTGKADRELFNQSIRGL